jgi:hypothetical protein
MPEFDARARLGPMVGSWAETALIIALVFGLLALNTVAIYSLFTSRGSYVIWDLHPPLMAARAVLQGVDPYSPQVTETIQMLDYGRIAQEGEDAQAFAYPAYLAYLLIPIAALPLPWAQAIWLSMLEAAIIISVIAGIEAWGWPESKLAKVAIVLWTLAFYPFTWAFILGQMSLLVGGVLAAGFWLTLTRKDRRGGVLLGLTIIKPNLVFLLVPGLMVWALARGRGRLVRWMGTVMLALVILPMPFTADWIPSFIRRLREYSSYSPFSAPAHLVGSWFPSETGTAATFVLAAAVLGVVAYGWREAVNSEARGALIWAFGASLLGAIWIAPQSSIVNQVVLLIPMIGVLGTLWKGGGPARVFSLSLLGFWLLLYWWLAQMPPISTAQPRYPVEHRVLAPVLPLTLGVLWLALRRRVLHRLGAI